jgi:hypothetical protein
MDLLAGGSHLLSSATLATHAAITNAPGVFIYLYCTTLRVTLKLHVCRFRYRFQNGRETDYLWIFRCYGSGQRPHRACHLKGGDTDLFIKRRRSATSCGAVFRTHRYQVTFRTMQRQACSGSHRAFAVPRNASMARRLQTGCYRNGWLTGNQAWYEK